MLDKQAMSNSLKILSNITEDKDLRYNLRSASEAVASMSDREYEEMLTKESFRLPGMDKIKGVFNKPGTPEKLKPGEFSTTPQQRSQNIKEKYQEGGPTGKLLTMFEHRDVQNAYKALPAQTKKLVDRYITRWKMGDLIGKAASEDKEALFEDKSPSGVYNALTKTLSNFSKKYDVSLLPSVIQEKFKGLKGNIELLEKSPERLPKGISEEEQAIIDRKNKEESLSKQDIENDKNINTFLQVMDKHFKTDLQKNLTPSLKNEYEKMTGDIVGQLRGDIEQGFRGSSPGSEYSKKSPYMSKEPVFEVKNPTPSSKKPSRKKPAPADPGMAGVPGKGKIPERVAKDSTVITSEGVDMNPSMIEIDENSEEIKKLSKILENNKL